MNLTRFFYPLLTDAVQSEKFNNIHQNIVWPLISQRWSMKTRLQLFEFLIRLFSPRCQAQHGVVFANTPVMSFWTVPSEALHCFPTEVSRENNKGTNALRGTFVADYGSEFLTGAVTPTSILCDQTKNSTLIWGH